MYDDELPPGTASNPPADDPPRGLAPAAPPPHRGHRAARWLGAVALVVLAGGAGGALATYLHVGTPSASGVSALLHSQLGVTPPKVAATRPLSAAAVAAKIEPAVVDINVTLAYGQGEAEGTGMILTPSGRVLTNNHVVEGAGTIQVVVPHHGTYQAQVVGVDPVDDVAVLQLKGAHNLPTMPFGNSAATQVGTPVVAIGNALGLGGPPSVTTGELTATGRAITASNDAGGTEHLTNMFQIDAPLQPGDSGGPLVDALTGRVVGMDTAAETTSGGFSTIGQNDAPSDVAFSIPINRALRIAQEIERGQASSSIMLTRQGFLGVEVSNPQNLPAYEQQQLGTTSGAAIVEILPNTPAASIGLEPGDVLVSVDGTTAPNINTLGNLIKEHAPGTKITVGWVTPSGAHESASVALTSAPVA